MTAEPAVLHLGWAHEAAESLARHGARTTFVVSAADAGTAAGHPDCAGTVVVRDPDRLEDVVAGLARAGIDVASFDVVCTADELPVVPAALLAEAYRAGSWLPLRTALAVRDKFVQKTLIRDAGLPVARCQVVDEVGELAARAPIPGVVKPLDGAGTQLTFAVTDPESLERATRAITASGQSGPWLVEEFVTGAEVHVDGVVREGRIRFLAVSRYLRNVIEFQRGHAVGSVVADPRDSPDLYRRARDLTAAALGALGHTDGVFHLEAFADGDALVFGECAGRLSGGLLVETVLAKFGVDLFDEWARAVLRRPSGAAEGTTPDDRSFGWVNLTGDPGRLTAVPSREDLVGRPGVLHAQLSLRPGDMVPDATSASHLRVARVVMTGDTEEATADGLRALARWFRGQVRVAA